MKFYTDKELRYFDFWGGAVANAEKLKLEELDEIEGYLEYLGQDFSETEINDMFWFDFESLCEAIGLTYNTDIDEIER